MTDKQPMVERPRLDDAAEFAVEFRPPKDLQAALSHPDRSTLCGGRFAVEVTPNHPMVMYCVDGQSLIATDEGLSPIAESDSHFIDSGHGIDRTSGVVSRGLRERVTVGTRLGYRITATPDHQIQRWSGNDIEWTEAGNLRANDLLVMRRGYGLGGIRAQRIPESMGELLGMIDGDGSLTESTLSLHVEVGEAALAQRMSGALEEATGYGFKSSPDANSSAVSLLTAHRSVVREWAAEWGLKRYRISRRVMSLAPDSLGAYLRGLFEADGHVSTEGAVSVASAHEMFARDVQAALFSLGILSRLSVVRNTTPYTKGRVRELWTVRILGGENRALFDVLVGFAGERKSSRLRASSIDPDNTWRKNDDFPVHFRQARARYAIRRRLERSSGAGKSASKIAMLREWIEYGYYFAPVDSVTPVGVGHVYDVVNSPTSAFVADGFIVHNCYRPNCIQTGVCSGPRFVPSLPLMERSAVLVDDEGKPAQTPRPMPSPRSADSRRLMQEMVVASRAAAKAAIKKDDPRSDEEIALDIGRVWSKTAQSARSGGWGPGPEGIG